MKINNLTIKYDEDIVLDNINLELEKGKTHILLGKSGVGKTSLLNAILGLIKYEGSINNNVLNPSVVFQEDRMIEFKSIINNIKFVAPNKTNEEIVDTLNLLNLEDVGHKYPNELSGGMRQRVNIARALVYDSELIIMDEPFKSIDSKNKLEILKRLKKYFKDNKKTVLIVTHDIESTLELSDLIHVIKKDKINTLENIGEGMKLKLFNTYE